MKRIMLHFIIFLVILASCSPATVTVTPTATQIAPTQTSIPLTETPFPSPTSTPLPIRITEVASLSKGSAGFVEWSPNREFYAVSGTLGVHIYDASSRKETKYIPKELAYDVAFTADSQLMAIGSFDYLTVIRLSDEKVLFEKDVSIPSEIVFSPNKTSIAYVPGCLSIECTAIVIVSDYSAQEDLFTLYADIESEEINLNQISFNADGTLLVAGGSNGSIYIWEMSTGQLKSTLLGHKDSVRGVQFSPINKSMLASYSDDGTVKLWSVEAQDAIKTLSGFQGRIEKISYVPDGSNLEIFTKNMMQVVDTSTGRNVSKEGYTDTDALLLQELSTSEGYIGNIDGLAYSPDGQTLAVSDRTSSPVVVWNIPTKQIKATIETEAARLIYSHQGKLFASVDESGEISIWDTDSYAKLTTIPTTKVDGLVFSPDDTKIAISSQWKINIWDVLQRKITQSINTGVEEIILLSYSPEGNNISAVEPNNFAAKTWDISTGELIHTFTVPSDPDYREVLNLSNGVLAIFKQTDIQDNTVELWDVNTGKQLQIFKGINDYTSPRMAYSPDGKVVAISYFYGITFYCSNTGKPIYVYDEIVNWIKFSFSPAGNYLAIGDDYGKIRLWDVSSIIQEPSCANP